MLTENQIFNKIKKDFEKYKIQTSTWYLMEDRGLPTEGYVLQSDNRNIPQELIDYLKDEGYAAGVGSRSKRKQGYQIKFQIYKTKKFMLKGNQNKLDLNHNGKLDSEDFKMLRGEKKWGGEMKMGGLTKNEDLLESFLTNNKDVKIGNLSTHYYTQGDIILLRNYGTLIATRQGKTVKISTKKYSSTTSKITNKVEALAKSMGLNVEKISEVQFKKGGKAKVPKRSAESIELDSNIKAKKPGKRISASGNVYYEYSPNRSDVNRKKKPYLEMGGGVEKLTEQQKESIKVAKEYGYIFDGIDEKRGVVRALITKDNDNIYIYPDGTDIQGLDIHKALQGWWFDPAGGLHHPDDNDPGAMYMKRGGTMEMGGIIDSVEDTKSHFGYDNESWNELSKEEKIKMRKLAKEHFLLGAKSNESSPNWVYTIGGLNL